MEVRNLETSDGRLIKNERHVHVVRVLNVKRCQQEKTDHEQVRTVLELRWMLNTKEQ